MKWYGYAFRCIAVVCAVVGVACVDKSYDLKDVSTEVTLGQGKTVVKIGELKPKRVADLLGDQKIDGLTMNEDGTFTLSLSGEGDPIEVENIQNRFTVPGTTNTFQVEYPSFDFDMKGIVIEKEQVIDVNTDELEQLEELKELFGGQFELPESAVEKVSNLKGSFKESFNGDDMHLLLDLPEQVDNIRRISFKDIENGHHGAPLHLTLDLNGLAGINGGGVINFKLLLSGGTFRILDANNDLLCEGNEYSEKYNVDPDVETIDFVIYVESLENTAALNDEHQLDIPLELSCDMSFDIKPKGGEFNLEEKPHFALSADFEYGDAEIVMNNNASLVEYHPAEPQKIKIQNLPKELKSVSRIDLVEGTAINFYANGLEWLGENADKVAVEVDLPEYLMLHAISGEGYVYDEETHKLSTTIADINDGVVLNVECIDFGAEGISPDENGEIVLDLAFDMSAHFVGDDSIKVSSLKHDEDLEITTGVSDMELTVKALTGCVDYQYTLEKELAVNGGEELEAVEINGVGLSPVITLNLENPLTLPLMAKGALTDDTGREIELNDIVINAATYADGDIIAAQNKIVIAAEKPEYECTFVKVDFDELLKGKIPSMMKVNLTISVDSTEEHTLYIDDQIGISYDYSVELPVAFTDKLDIRSKYSFDDLGKVFGGFGDIDIKVGDIKLIAEVENTLPLGFMTKIVLRNADGEPTSVQLVAGQSEDGWFTIKGSEDGKTPAKDNVAVFDVQFDEHNLSEITEVESLDIELRAVSSSAEGESVSINANQYVAVVFKFQLENGISLDIKDFMADVK